MATNYANYAKIIPNILNNSFIKNNLAIILIIIVMILVITKIIANPKYRRQLSGIR